MEVISYLPTHWNTSNNWHSKSYLETCTSSSYFKPILSSVSHLYNHFEPHSQTPNMTDYFISFQSVTALTFALALNNASSVWVYVSGYHSNSSLVKAEILKLHNKQLLCAYTDGTVILSEPIGIPRFHQFYFIVKCRVPRWNIQLKQHILNASQFSSIGITLFDTTQSIQNTHVSTVPVCQNTDATHHHHYELSGCLVVHPSFTDQNHQSLLRMIDFIQFHRLQGFDHFYVYDHLFNRNAQNKFIFKNGLKQWIEQDIVTYIEWNLPHLGDSPWYFQFAAISHCFYSFRDESKLLSPLDIDLYLMPKLTKHSSLIHYIHDMQSKKHIKMFRFKCFVSYLDVTDESMNIGCDEDGMFHTFLDRHSCLIENERKDAMFFKYIADPRIVYYPFVHGVSKLNDRRVNKRRIYDGFDDILCVHASDNVHKLGFPSQVQLKRLRYLKRLHHHCVHQEIVYRHLKLFEESDFGTQLYGKRRIQGFINQNGTFCWEQ
eukprot:258013_1